MTEPQVRGTDRNEAADQLRRYFQRAGTGSFVFDLLTAALDWERSRTVERTLRIVETTTPLSVGAPLIEHCLRAALDPATPGEEAEDER